MRLLARLALTAAHSAHALTAPAPAKSPADPAAPVRAFIDAFNVGDSARGFAAYAPGSISIIDEFAPHLWIGPDAAHAWAAGYDAHARATGVRGGHVGYSPPTRVEVTGRSAYIIMPTVFTYKLRGRPQVEEATLNAVTRLTPGGWKIVGWTWTGVAPHAPR